MLTINDHDGVAEIAMNRPPVNAMNKEFIDALLEAVHQCSTGGARALVFSGREGLFSAGLDVPDLLQHDRDGIAEFWTSFFQLMNNVASCPVPVVAAITGHSPAGGAVLAMHCDYRVATQGDFKIGMNEVQVGLPVPRNLLGALEFAVGERKAAQLAMAGRMLSPDEALQIGMVDQIAEPGQALAASLEWLAGLLQLPPVAMNKTRLAAKSALLEKLAETASFARIATDYWFSDETQRMMNELVASLKK